VYFQVALFLFREGRLSKKQIGVFIGGHHDFNQQVLSEIVMLHEFTHLILVQALRQFLWSFRYFHLKKNHQKWNDFLGCKNKVSKGRKKNTE
jgi:hypothetical protein